MGDNRRGTGFCREPEVRIFGEADGTCRNFDDPPTENDNDCPTGWRLVGTDKTGCIGVDPFRGFKSVCQRTTDFKTSPVALAECCLESDGSDPTCPPNFCRANIDGETCRQAIDAVCLTDPRQLTGPRCREWVLRDENRSRADVVAAVQRYCPGGFGIGDKLCRCVNADNPDLCDSDDCFAIRNFNLKHLRYCAAEECTVPEEGVFQPTGAVRDCPSQICAPALEIVDSNFTIEEASTIFQTCQNATQREQFIEKAADSESIPQLQGIEDREARKDALRNILGLQAQQRAGENGNAQPSSPTDEEDELLPTWAWVLIGIAAAIVLILIIVVIVVLVRRRRNRDAQIQMPPPPQVYMGYDDF